MGKASRNRNKRKMQRKAPVDVFDNPNTFPPISMENVRQCFSYWITGYYWEHDVKIVEPFCASWMFGSWKITNLNTSEMEYYESLRLLEQPERLLIFEDRLSAINVCEALENEKLLLDSFKEYMSDEDLVKYLNGKDGLV